MAEFNYTEYLRNNPLLNSEGKQPLTENQRPGYHPDGTPKSNAEMSDDEREEFYLNLDDVSEEKASSKMKVSELKAKIKEDIISLLQEEDNSSELEDELMADLDEEITEAKEDEEEDVEVDVEADVEDEVGDEIGGGDADALDPEAGLTQDEQDIQNALKVAYDNAVALGDEKLSKQIGNTITMFTRTRVVGDLN